MRCGYVLMTAALVLAACGSHARPKLVKVPSLPGSLVEADGHKVYFDCEGTGSPTVVFLSGWGVESADWLQVFDGVSRRTRTCEYDRGAVGVTGTYSALPKRVRDAHDQVRELEQMLRNADIPKPYVLVGHSWGGALARLYAGTHDDVKGLVLIDSSSPGQDAAITAALPPRKPDESAIIGELRSQQTGHPLANPEYLDWGKSLNEVAAVKSLGDMPLVVVTAGSTFQEATPQIFPVWLRLQNRLTALSSRSVHVVATKSSHFVQLDDPDLTKAAVLAAVDAARNDGRLRSCAAIFAGVTPKRCVR